MGLCKCPKKKVTNQFCFEHRVNVCENCLVSNHSKCIVQSYLNWLQDSDYEALCLLCDQSLATEDCVRLLCYHVFHLRCVDEFASKMPSHTAPAGYACPTCQTGLFPATNVMSPVADALRKVLAKFVWAREGLGMPMVENSVNHIVEADSSRTENVALIQQQGENHVPHSVVSMEVPPQQNRADTFATMTSFTAALSSPRKMYDSTDGDSLRPLIDHDDDKYKRRSAVEWFSRWFSSRGPVRRHVRADTRLVYRRWFVLSVLMFIGLCTLILIFVRLGRTGGDSDPLLDPHFNPNIRVHEDSNGPKDELALDSAKGVA